MTTDSRPEWGPLVTAFNLPGVFAESVPYGSGHINDTYALTMQDDGGATRYILQRINGHVFKDIPALMDNIARVTAHIPGGLTLIPSTDGLPFTRDADSRYWRCYVFIEYASTHDVIQNAGQARAAAFSFGEFQGKLVDLPGPRLHETILNFHHTRSRFNTLQHAIDTDSHHRLGDIADEVEFARRREAMVDRLIDRTARGEIPERITHNDTKINNVMLNDATGEGEAVIDLDTVMPGLVLYDFGDMVRTATNAAAEDETDLSKVEARMEIFDALAEGYLASAKSFLNAAEIEELVFSGRLITFEIGLRFLTDHLQGDVYFKTHRPNHNLERARCQFALVKNLEDNDDTMQGIIADRLTAPRSR